MKNIRVAALKAKGKEGTQKNAYLYVSNGYDTKKVTLLKFLQSIADEEGGLPADLMVQMKTYLESQPELKPDTKLLMQFGAFMRDEAKERGPDALATELPFDQRAILEVNSYYNFLSVMIIDINTHYSDFFLFSNLTSS